MATYEWRTAKNGSRRYVRTEAPPKRAGVGAGAMTIQTPAKGLVAPVVPTVETSPVSEPVVEAKPKTTRRRKKTA